MDIYDVIYDTQHTDCSNVTDACNIYVISNHISNALLQSHCGEI